MPVTLEGHTPVIGTGDTYVFSGDTGAASNLLFVNHVVTEEQGFKQNFQDFIPNNANILPNLFEMLTCYYVELALSTTPFIPA